MSSPGILSTEYNRISQLLLDFNDAIMFLKDVFLGKNTYENNVVLSWMNTVQLVLADLLYPDKSKDDLHIPRSALDEVGQLLRSDQRLRHDLEVLYQRLTPEGIKRGLTDKDFAILDRVASSLSESAAQTFRKIWRAG